MGKANDGEDMTGNMIKRLATLCVLLAVLATTPGAYAGALGADVNADVDAFGHGQMDMGGLLAFSQKNTVYALPMYNLPPGDHARYWDNMVEQYGSAQIDFVAVWLKGNDQPATFANLVAALDGRGLGGRIKVMPFDDNPASWTALWNSEHGDGYGYKVPFDVADPAHWAFVWDKNLKAFFQNVPDSHRYKIQGRPVYMIWSGAPAFLSNLSGNGSKLLDYVRRQCRSTFGFNPYIIVSGDWVKNDPSSAAPGVVDAVYPWFTPVPGPVYSTWNVSARGGITLGACIPQFRISNDADPNSLTWIVDPKHGQTLADGLDGTVGAGSAATFIEGFDDYWENTTLWRARNLDQDGRALGYAQTYYDYPNQRINLVRRHSNNAFPVNLKEEAEGCDSFSGALALPGRPDFYRNGPIAIEDTTYRYGGYDVCHGQAGETLQWQEVPLEGTLHLLVRVATASTGGKMHFVIDGVKHRPVNVPKTGGAQTWATVDAGAYTFACDSYHTVALVSDTPGISVNWWQTRTAALADGLYRIVARQGEAAPDAGFSGQKWRLRALGGGRYAIHTVNQDGAAPAQWTITPRPDGFCSLLTVGTRAGTPTLAGTDARRREWSFIPTR